MAYCRNCLFYSELEDELNRDFNDIDEPDSHYCPMYRDKIPDGVYEGPKECDKYTPRE